MGNLGAKRLKGMKYGELQALAKELGVNASGKAGAIRERIMAAMRENEETECPEGSEPEATGKGEQAVADPGRQEGERKPEGMPEAPTAGRETGERMAVASERGTVMVRVVEKFLDKRLNQIKDAGEIYEVDGDRATELLAVGVVEIQ